MKPTIRQATWVDAEPINELRMTVMSELAPGADVSGKSAQCLEALSATIADPGPVALWVAHFEGAVVGYARAEALGPNSPRLVALREIAVREDARRNGIASKLLKAALGDIPALASMPITGEAAASFFTKHGFEATDHMADDDDFPELTLMQVMR